MSLGFGLNSAKLCDSDISLCWTRSFPDCLALYYKVNSGLKYYCVVQTAPNTQLFSYQATRWRSL